MNTNASNALIREALERNTQAQEKIDSLMTDLNKINANLKHIDSNLHSGFNGNVLHSFVKFKSYWDQHVIKIKNLDKKSSQTKVEKIANEILKTKGAQ